MVTKAAPKATAPAPVADPFAGLLETAVLEDKKVSARPRDRADIDVPAEYVAFVEDAYAKNKRPVFPIGDKAAFDAMAALFRAAGDKSEKGLTVTVKPRYDGEGEDAPLTHLTFTVGLRRGAKGKKATDGVADAK